MESKRASELQEGGRHYKDMPIQPAEFCQRNRLNWCESNAVKYVVRHASKNGAQDIRKAIHYLNLLLEWEYPAHGKTAADYTPLAPEEVKAINESISPPSLCGTCIRQGCPVDCAEHTTECVNYLAPKEEAAQVEKAVFSFSFPAAEKYMGAGISAYVTKLREEVGEVSDAETPTDRVVELLDVIHVAETAIRTQIKDYGLDIQDLADHVVAKNRQRNYYTKG